MIISIPKPLLGVKGCVNLFLLLTSVARWRIVVILQHRSKQMDNDDLVNAAEIVRTFAISRQRAHELMGNYEIVWRDGSKYVTRWDFEKLKRGRLKRMGSLIFDKEQHKSLIHKTPSRMSIAKALIAIGTSYSKLCRRLECSRPELTRLIRHGEFSEEMLTKIDAAVPGGRDAFLDVVKDFKKVNTNP